ncbi:MAG: hypothetical protein IPO92_20285 [Saprospiraceae bacterium]|nr:hypothetical protein [Saprospiraceae bacterium]
MAELLQLQIHLTHFYLTNVYVDIIMPNCSTQLSTTIEIVQQFTISLQNAELTDCKKNTRLLTASAQSNCSNCTYTWVLSNGLNSTTYTTSVPNLSVNPPNFYNTSQNLSLSVTVGTSSLQIVMLQPLYQSLSFVVMKEY